MKQPEVTVIDYGVGNLLSVRRGLEHCGATVKVTKDAQTIRNAARVVLPGVGAFAGGMEALRRSGLDDVVREVAVRGVPLLGICLGMQMLLDASEEFGEHSGLGIIPGRVVVVPSTTRTGDPQKVPHVGWNALGVPEGRENWENTLLDGVRPGEAVYFVHSFMARPTSASDRLADCAYGGQPVSAAIVHENVVGCQFHPEKSGAVGLKVLKRFVER